MKKDYSQKFITYTSAILAVVGFGYFLVYPFAKDYFKKKESVVGSIVLDQSFFKKLENLKDNTIYMDKVENSTIPNLSEDSQR